MVDKIHVVPHFHWDREWYFTAEESKILLVNNMEEVLSMLETNKDYPYFVLDGQTAILEDYFSVKPENCQRVKSLVEQGKLIIGPWYTQTDEMVVGGESIVRNLLYGMLDCEEFGPCMKIGYLPDSFGQSERIPQILNGFGIKHCMFWRGTSERMGANNTEFYWEGDDNSKVLVQLLPLGYAIGKYLPAEEIELKKRLDKYFPVLDKGATTNHILLPNGHDQMPIQKNIFDVMSQIEAAYPGRKAFLSRYEEVFKEIENATELKTLKGEFLDGKYMRVHRSIYSSRSDLKSFNTRIENKITNILEPLMSIAYRLGFVYESGLVEVIWKEIMKNHAHDSIGCCCSDKVHREIADRFFLAEDRTDNLIAFYKRKIVDAMGCEISLDKLTAFNLLPYERTGVITGEIITKMNCFYLLDEQENEISFEIISSEIVDAGLIDRQIVHYGDYHPFIKYKICIYDSIPSMGYKTYLIKEKEKRNLSIAVGETSNEIENKYYKIGINDNGTLKIIDKGNGLEYTNVLMIEDGSDDGDGYDFSPLENDFIITSEHVKAQSHIVNYSLISKASIKLDLCIPKNLESRKQKINDSLLSVELNLVVKKDSPIIEVIMKVDNQSEDHRVRVLIPNGLESAFSVSDNQFGAIRRPVVDSAMEIWEEENWSERPDSIYPFLSYVHGDAKNGLAILTNSVREYEMIGNSFETIAITIFRSVGVLGKENLLRRPGRPSGIKLETPDSQLKGVHSFEFAITTHIENAPSMAKEYLTPIITYNKMPYNAMKLNESTVKTPYRFSLLSITNPSIIMSAFKKAEKENELLIRFYNPSECELTSDIISEYASMDEVRLDETVIKSDLNHKFLSFTKNQNRTFRFHK